MPLIEGKLCEATERGHRQVRPLVRNVKDGSVMVLIPGGEFEMGDGKDSGCPKHRVRVDAFWMGVYCVTNAQYGRFVKRAKHRPPENQRWNQAAAAEHPVTDVSWEDATAYAKWAGCELPTEAQWEKACRGPSGLTYPWGNEWDVWKCRHAGNKGNEQTCAVWKYGLGASGYGTYQQSGNVWEWCRDWCRGWYEGYVTTGVQRNPTGPARGSSRVNRGGSWILDDASNFRGAYRPDGLDHSPRYGALGFRLVRTAS